MMITFYVMYANGVAHPETTLWKPSLAVASIPVFIVLGFALIVIIILFVIVILESDYNHVQRFLYQYPGTVRLLSFRKWYHYALRKSEPESAKQQLDPSALYYAIDFPKIVHREGF